MRMRIIPATQLVTSLPLRRWPSPARPTIRRAGRPTSWAGVVHAISGLDLRDFLVLRLFGPLGIRNPQWLRCPLGFSLGAIGLQLRTSEITRIAQLPLHEGTCGRHRLVPGDYIARMTVDTTDTGRAEPDNPGSGSREAQPAPMKLAVCHAARSHALRASRPARWPGRSGSEGRAPWRRRERAPGAALKPVEKLLTRRVRRGLRHGRPPTCVRPYVPQPRWLSVVGSGSAERSGGKCWPGWRRRSSASAVTARWRWARVAASQSARSAMAVAKTVSRCR